MIPAERRRKAVPVDSCLTGSTLAAECLVDALRRKPATAALLPFWAIRGREYTRRRLAERARVDVAALPYRATAVEELRTDGAALATGGDPLAREIAAHLRVGYVEEAPPGAPPQPWRWGAVFRALRPYQWLKNTLVFLPFLLSHDLGSVAKWAAVVRLFLAFSFCASAGYVVNDIVDRSQDRRHPRRRNRPIASGDVPLGVAAWLPLPLVGAAAACCAFLPPSCGLALALYLAATILYSTKAKDLVMADVLLLAGLYLLRLLAGSIATQNAVSHWLLAFAVALFLSLALSKRVSELIAWRAIGQTGAPGRRYRTDDAPVLEMMAVAAGFVACLTMVLYIQSPEILRLYRRPEYLWVGVVALLYWLGRLFIYSHRGECPDDPLLFAVQDRTTLVVLAVAALGALCAV